MTNSERKQLEKLCEYIRRKVENLADECAHESGPFREGARALLHTVKNLETKAKKDSCQHDGKVVQVLNELCEIISEILKLATRSLSKSPQQSERMARHLIQSAGQTCRSFLPKFDRALRASLPPRVFISFDKADLLKAQDFAKKLEQRGLDPFVANDSIRAGKEWRREIMKHLRSSTSVLVIISPDALSSQWVMGEMGIAMGAEIPIVIGRSGIIAENLPSLIREYQSRDLATEESQLVDDLVASITDYLE